MEIIQDCFDSLRNRKPVRSLHDIYNSFESAPQKLLAICLAQVLLLFIGVFVGHGSAECYLVRGPPDYELSLDCSRCRPIGDMQEQQVVVIFSGLFTIGIGFIAAIFKNKDMCHMYSMIMMIFGSMVGIIGVLGVLEVPTLQAAVDSVRSNADCRVIGGMMVANFTTRAWLYVLNAALDLAGAVYAMHAKIKFDYDEILVDHKRAEKFQQL